MYRFRKGEQYRVRSVTEEDVIMDRGQTVHSKITALQVFRVKEVSSGRALLHCRFRIIEVIDGSPKHRREEYISEYRMDSLGRMAIPDRYVMPVVRNLPVFPTGDVHVGESWTAEAIEVHDLRASFGTEEPFRFPVLVRYRLLGFDNDMASQSLGPSSRDSSSRDSASRDSSSRDSSSRDSSNGDKGNLPLRRRTLSSGAGNVVWISAEYEFFRKIEKFGRFGAVYPRVISGKSRRRIRWDISGGRMISSQEEFHYVFRLNIGRVVEYIGKTETEVMPGTPLRNAEGEEDGF